MMFSGSQLPLNWKVARISEVAEVNPKLDKRSINDDLEVSFVSMPSVEAETGVIDVSNTRRFAEVKKGYTGFMEGDVLFAKITPCMENGKMALIPALKNNLGFGSTEFHVFRVGQNLEKKFLYYYVSSKQVRFDAEHNMTGAVGQKRVPTSYISDYQIPVPPLEQQKLIITKIEELFSELDSGIVSLKTAREQLKIYRQALLKHAFEGKLTEQWRKDNADKLETPEQLLTRIQTERESRYQQQLNDWKQAVKDWEAKGKEGKKPSKPKKLAALKNISKSELSELTPLPIGWSYVRLGHLIDEPTYGTSAKCEYDSGNTGVLRIPNIKSDAIDDGDLKFASFDEGEVKHFALEEGDLLTIRSNGSISLVGACALVKEKDTKYIFAGYLIRLRPNQSSIHPSFLLAVLTSHLLRRQIETAAKSTSGVNNINSGELQNLIIPIPTIQEQNELLKHLDTSTPSINATELEIEKQLLKSETLRQSILKKAFSGQLVPQDPNDEPASELLARIKVEKTVEQAVKKTK